MLALLAGGDSFAGAGPFRQKDVASVRPVAGLSVAIYAQAREESMSHTPRVMRCASNTGQPCLIGYRNES